MRVLCLSHYYPPENGALAVRMSENAKNWVREGLDVTVVTCVPNYPRGRIFQGYKNRLWQSETIDGVEVIRLFTLPVANEGVLLRTLNYVVFALGAIVATAKLPKCDVVMSTSPNLFCGAAGWAVARLKRVPWVLEIRDLWPHAISATGAVKNKVMLAPFHVLERFSYRRADAIVTVTRSFARHIKDNGGDEKAISIIPNGICRDRFAESDGTAFRKAHGISDDTIVVSYVGTHGLVQRLGHVLDTARKLAHRPDILFVMVGDGGDKKALQQRKEAEKIDNLIFVDEAPLAAIPDILAATDITLAPLSKNPLFEATVPVKMYESMAAARPVVLAAQGEAAAMVTQARAGIVVPPENSDEIAKAVETLASDPALRRRMGENGKAYVERHHDRGALSAGYAALLRRLAHGDGSQRGTFVATSPSQDEA